MTAVIIASSEPDSTFHRQAVSIGDVWRENGAADTVEHHFTGGSVENAHLVAERAVDFGCSAANWLVPASTGKPPFAAALPVRLLAPINSGPLFFAAPAASPLKTFSELRGKRVALGIENSGMVQHFHGILKALGLSLDDFQPVYVGVFEGGEMMAAGEVDAQFQPPIPNVHFSQILEKTPVKVLPFSEIECRSILDHVPYYAEALIAKGSFPGHDVDTTTVAVVNIFEVHAEAEAETTFERARLIISHAQDLAARNALFKGLDQLLAESGRRIIPVLAGSGALQHSAAARAFKEAGLLA
jgi:TRAP transporter TAXI family solute receptor